LTVIVPIRVIVFKSATVICFPLSLIYSLLIYIYL
jgi:hypothetical protein